MKLLASLSALLGPAPQPDAAVRAGLRRIAELLGPALAAERAFERRLAGPVAHALAYCDSLVGALPPSIDIHRPAFAENPLVHALFATADDIGAMLGRSPALRDYLEQPQAWLGEHCHALMAARRHEKEVLGVARQGQVLATDVPQRLLYFSDQTIALPAGDEQQARQRLREAAFDSLLQTFAEHIEGLRRERETLQVEREFEKTRLRAAPGGGAADERARRTRRIEELDACLRAHADALLPARQIVALADFLMAPQQALSMSPVSFRVDRGGALAIDGHAAGADARSVSFMELASRDRRRHVVVPVRIPCDELRQALAQARVERDRIILI